MSELDVRKFSIATASSQPTGITGGPDGNLWVTEQLGDKIDRITTSGVLTEFPGVTAGSYPGAIASRLPTDGDLWFVEFNGDRIGRITTAGTVTEFPIPTSGALPSGIALGPDGNLWFTEFGPGKIGKLVPGG